MDEERLQKLVNVVKKELDLKNFMSLKFIEEALTAIQVFDNKHTEKGLSSYGEFGPLGVLIKLSEKYNTLKEYYTVLVNSEKETELNSVDLEKLWQDLSVYSLMGKLVEEGEWK